jgi:hypothetical protein
MNGFSTRQSLLIARTLMAVIDVGLSLHPKAKIDVTCTNHERITSQNWWASVKQPKGRETPWRLIVDIFLSDGPSHHGDLDIIAAMHLHCYFSKLFRH